jgi:hypothetical protein
MRPCLDLRQVEKIVDHFRQFAHAALNELQLAELLGVSGPSMPLHQDVRNARDGSQRGAKLMAHVRQESALEVGRFAQLQMALASSSA